MTTTRRRSASSRTFAITCAGKLGKAEFTVGGHPGWQWSTFRKFDVIRELLPD
jgi:hypothetical protein